MARIEEAAAIKSHGLVSATAERMRDLILSQAPDALIGSLPDLARQLGVGVATVQQAARVLEHEGLLEVRRGPGGGYFGRRPDAASLERSVATYLRVRHADDYEALELMTLLDCELMPAAAQCADRALFDELRRVRQRVDTCLTSAERVSFEDDLHAVLFRMVDRPLMELLAGVAMRFYRSQPIPQIFEGAEGLSAWRLWRYHILDAILDRDPDRARFEAERHRRELLKRLDRERSGRLPGG